MTEFIDSSASIFFQQEFINLHFSLKKKFFSGPISPTRFWLKRPGSDRDGPGPNFRVSVPFFIYRTDRVGPRPRPTCILNLISVVYAFIITKYDVNK